MASELKVDKFTGVTTAGSIVVTGEGNSTTTNLQQGLAKSWLLNWKCFRRVLLRMYSRLHWRLMLNLKIMLTN